MSSKWQHQDPATNLDLSKKKVHFQETEESYRNDESATASLQTFSNERYNSSHIGKYLQICPAHELLFSSNSLYLNECSSVSLTLTNITNEDVAYKVRTTSPLNYRVRPSMGLIRPQKTAEVIVHLSKCSLGRSVIHDKFLVMAMPLEANQVDPDAMADLNDLWHKSPKDKVAEHKIRCGILPETPPASTNDTPIEKILFKIDAMNSDLRNEIRSLRQLLYVVLALCLVMLTSVLLLEMQLNGTLTGPSTSSSYSLNSCPNLSPYHRPV